MKIKNAIIVGFFFSFSSLAFAQADSTSLPGLSVQVQTVRTTNSQNITVFVPDTTIPAPPTCPSGEVQTAAPTWNSASNSWVGLQCLAPVPAVSNPTPPPTPLCRAATPSNFVFTVQDTGFWWDGVKIAQIPGGMANSSHVVVGGYEYYGASCIASSWCGICRVAQ